MRDCIACYNIHSVYTCMLIVLVSHAKMVKEHAMVTNFGPLLKI